MNTFTVPLSKLQHDPENVRTNRSDDAINNMTAAIDTVGMLTPLLVRKGPKGKWYVTAGGTRLEAQRRLAKLNGDRKHDPQVACINIENLDPTLISTMENQTRTALSPVAQFLAYKKMARSYTVEEIASIFSVSEHNVRQRMKLGELHNDILKDLENGNIEQGYAMALTLTDDQDLQLKMRKEFPHSHQAGMIRQTLKSDKFLVRSAEFDLEKYSGTITKDLFAWTKDDPIGGVEEYFDNAGLALKLQIERMHEIAQELEDDGWKFVDVQPRNFTWSERDEYISIFDFQTTDRDPVTGAEQLKKRISKKDKAKSGVLLYLGDKQQIHRYGGILSEEDKKQVMADRKKGSDRAETDLKEADIDPGSEATWSNSFQQALNELGLVMMARQLSLSHRQTFRLLLSNLLSHMAFSGPAGGPVGASIVPYTTGDWPNDQLTEHEASIMQQRAFKALHPDFQNLVHNSPQGIFIATKEWSDEQVLHAIAYIVSGGLHLTPKDQLWQLVADELEIEPRDGWTPDATFFERLTKPQMLKIVEDLSGVTTEYMKLLATKKKGELVKELEMIFAKPAEIQHLHGMGSEFTKAVNSWIPQLFKAKE